MKTFLAAAAAALTLGGAAAAQPYGGYYDRYDPYGAYGRYSDRYDPYDRRYYDRWDWYQRNRPGYERYDRYDRRAYDRYYGGRWRPGDRFPYYRSRAYVLPNYRAYGLPPPPRGHRYYRTNEGDILMAAIASGIIAAVVGRLDGGYDGRRYGWY